LTQQESRSYARNAAAAIAVAVKRETIVPLYEYQCTACGHRFEVIQKFSDKPVKKCPKCGKPVEKLLSSPAIQFKGTGWYITDYARKGAASDSKAGAKDGKDSSKDSAAGGGEAPATTSKDASAESSPASKKPRKD
jgi:putative FmdB family regulatory protein